MTNKPLAKEMYSVLRNRPEFDRLDDVQKAGLFLMCVNMTRALYDDGFRDICALFKITDAEDIKAVLLTALED